MNHQEEITNPYLRWLSSSFNKEDGFLYDEIERRGRGVNPENHDCLLLHHSFSATLQPCNLTADVTAATARTRAACSNKRSKPVKKKVKYNKILDAEFFLPTSFKKAENLDSFFFFLIPFTFAYFDI